MATRHPVEGPGGGAARLELGVPGAERAGQPVDAAEGEPADQSADGEDGERTGD